MPNIFHPDLKVEMALFTAPNISPSDDPSAATGIARGLADASAWIDISQYVKRVNVRRGRNRQTDRFDAATAQVTLDNRSRIFDPTYVAGPYYGKIKPMRRIRIQGSVRIPRQVVFPNATVFDKSWDYNADWDEAGNVKDAGIQNPTTDDKLKLNILHDFGNGADGFVGEVPGTFNINQVSLVGRSTPDAVCYPALDTMSDVTRNYVDVLGDATTSLAVNDECVLYCAQCEHGGDTSNVGYYHFFRIASIVFNGLATRVTSDRSRPNTKWFGYRAYTDQLVSGGITSKTFIQRVPNYAGASLFLTFRQITCSAWGSGDGFGGLFIKSNATWTSGRVILNSLGYRGGSASFPEGEGPNGYTSNGAQPGTPGAVEVCGSSGGGGGANYGNGVNGANGYHRDCAFCTSILSCVGGFGEFAYNSGLLQDKIFLGGGGAFGNTDTGGNGGRGGGFIWFSAPVFNSPTLQCSAGLASGQGGGGAGGSIYVRSPAINVDATSNPSNGTGGGSSAFCIDGGGGNGGAGIIQYDAGATIAANTWYYWKSAIWDAGVGKKGLPISVKSKWDLDESGITPRFQFQSSDIGTFSGEQSYYPSPTTYYQDGTSNDIDNDVEKTLLGLIETPARYWRMIAGLNSGTNLDSTPDVDRIIVKGSTGMADLTGNVSGIFTGFIDDLPLKKKALFEPEVDLRATDGFKVFALIKAKPYALIDTFSGSESALIINPETGTAYFPIAGSDYYRFTYSQGRGRLERQTSTFNWAVVGNDIGQRDAQIEVTLSEVQKGSFHYEDPLDTTSPKIDNEDGTLIIFRAASISNYWAVTAGYSAYHLWRVQGGAFTLVASGNSVPVSGDVLKIDFHGGIDNSVFSVYVNDQLQMLYAPPTDPNNTYTLVGLGISGLSTISVFNAFRVTKYWPEELSGSRVIRILDMAGWPAVERIISVGQSTMAARLMESTYLMEELDKCAEAEVARMFIGGGGDFIYHDRQVPLKPPYSVSQAHFNDYGDIYSISPNTVFPYEDIEFSYGEDTLYNYIITSRKDGVQFEVKDDTSINEFYERTLEKTDLDLAFDNDAQALGQWLLAMTKDPQLVIRGMQLDGDSHPDLWIDIFTREIGDKILVENHPLPKTSAIISQASIIEGIDHDIDIGNKWDVRYYTSPADIYVYWILDDPIFSVLGSTTRLAF